ncbi:hypothetical protein KWI06_24065, partial [Enterobacter cloacae]|uniref:hypothetical protein n=1 Tax=Enterobacter cloacae TaxID=550 RepID=UPI0021CFBBAF
GLLEGNKPLELAHFIRVGGDVQHGSQFFDGAVVQHVTGIGMERGLDQGALRLFILLHHHLRTGRHAGAIPARKVDRQRAKIDNPAQGRAQPPAARQALPVHPAQAAAVRCWLLARADDSRCALRR